MHMVLSCIQPFYQGLLIILDLMFHLLKETCTVENPIIVQALLPLTAHEIMFQTCPNANATYSHLMNLISCCLLLVMCRSFPCLAKICPKSQQICSLNHNSFLDNATKDSTCDSWNSILMPWTLHHLFQISNITKQTHSSLYIHMLHPTQPHQVSTLSISKILDLQNQCQASNSLKKPWLFACPW